jgi:hypothetical protein
MHAPINSPIDTPKAASQAGFRSVIPSANN